MSPGSQNVKWKDEWRSVSKHSRPSEDAYNSQPAHRPLSSEFSTPPRQDSAYFSVNGWDEAGSELDAEVQARQVHARERVEILRARLLRTRHTVQARRDKIRGLRESARDLSARLMKKLEEIISLGDARNLRGLTPFYEESRRAQDELGPAEEELNQLESRLSDEEQDLEQEEDHFYRHYDVSIVALPDSKLDEALSPLMKPYHPPDSELGSPNLENELVREYFERVTEANSLKAELEELEVEYAHLNEDAAFRKRHNINISHQTAEFLADYPEVYRQIIWKISATEDRLFSLRYACIDRGLFSKTDYLYEAHDAFKNDILDAVNDTLDRSPLLASSIGAHSLEHKTPGFRDKREYINNWLLGWTQNCRMEALQLRAWIYFEYLGQEAKVAEDEWSRLALKMWDKDEAGADTDVCCKMSKMDAIRGGTGRPGFTKSGFSSSFPSSFPSLWSLSVDLRDEDPVNEIAIGSEAEPIAKGEDDDEPIGNIHMLSLDRGGE